MLETREAPKKTTNKTRLNGKPKGKGIVHNNRSKTMLKILRPSNRLGSSSLGPSQNPFDDGSRMGPIILDKDLKPILFQANNPSLNGKKHVAVRFQGKATDLAGNKQNNCSNLFIPN